MKTLLVFVMMLAAVPAMAQWVEQGDAGNLPATAQIPTDTPSLVSISGTIDPGDVDMYLITVQNPATFMANTCGAGATWDTQLFLFTTAGIGVTMDDDTCDPGLQSQIGAFDTCMYATGPGDYYLAISRYNVDPRDAGNVTILGLAGCNSTNANPVASWSTTTSAAGAYTITLVGVVATESTTWGAVKSLYR
jgi:hypothetical protein